MSHEPDPKTRILILDDHALFREGVASLLTRHSEFEIVALCASQEEGLQALASTSVDLVLLHLDLGGKRSVDFLARARSSGFSGKVLVITAGLDSEDRKWFNELGASGVLLEHHSSELLVESIRLILAGYHLVDERLMEGLPAESNVDWRPNLTPLERQVLQGVLEGLANKQIADRLGSSEHSVKASMQRVFEKFGVRTRSQVVRLALRRFKE